MIYEKLKTIEVKILRIKYKCTFIFLIILMFYPLLVVVVKIIINGNKLIHIFIIRDIAKEGKEN